MERVIGYHLRECHTIWIGFKSKVKHYRWLIFFVKRQLNNTKNRIYFIDLKILKKFINNL